MRYLKPVIINCMIHQQVLFRSYLNLLHEKELALSIVNFICSYGLNHHEFLLEMEAKCPVLTYKIAV